MRATFIAAAHERGLRPGNPRKCIGRTTGTRDTRWVIVRSNNNKVVIHDFAAMSPVTGGNKGLLGRFGMHQDRIHIARFAKSQRLTCANHQKLHIQIKVLFDRGQQDIRKTRVFKRRRHRQPHHIGRNNLRPKRRNHRA